MSASASSLIATHLNAPVGAVLAASDVLDALRHGRLSCKTDLANAVLGGMFVEIEPRLIAQCALEAGVNLKQANLLYLDTVVHAFPKCPQWESAVAVLV